MLSRADYKMIADFNFQCDIWALIQHHKRSNLLNFPFDSPDYKQVSSEFDDIENKFWASDSMENMFEIWQYLTFENYC